MWAAALATVRISLNWSLGAFQASGTATRTGIVCMVFETLGHQGSRQRLFKHSGFNTAGMFSVLYSGCRAALEA